MLALVSVAAGSSDIAVTESLIVGLMLVAALVGIAVSRLRVPYTVALVLVGLGLSVSNAFAGVDLTSDLILLVFLPPLLFEGAINMNLDDLVLRWRQVALLAIVGTAVSAATIASLLTLVPGMSFEYAVVIGVILAATDPASVLAIFKENGVVTGLRTLMEGESVFNDALAIVAYIIAIDIAFGGKSVTAGDALTHFGVEVAVGVSAGGAIGFVAHRLMGALDDHLVEITLSLVTAYGSYLVADKLGGSGVIAVIVGGLLIGNYGTRFAMSASSRVTLTDFWEVLAFLANSALFLVIGLEFDVAALRGTHVGSRRGRGRRDAGQPGGHRLRVVAAIPAGTARSGSHLVAHGGVLGWPARVDPDRARARAPRASVRRCRRGRRGVRRGAVLADRAGQHVQATARPPRPHSPDRRARTLRAPPRRDPRTHRREQRARRHASRPARSHRNCSRRSTTSSPNAAPPPSRS